MFVSFEVFGRTITHIHHMNYNEGAQASILMLCKLLSFIKCFAYVCRCNIYVNYHLPLGVCICQHNTLGDNCEFCQPGYYGNALDGTPFDCQLCPCPGGSECVQDAFGEVICINCPPGYVGEWMRYPLLLGDRYQSASRSNELQRRMSKKFL